MTQLFPILPRCHVSALRLITGLAVVGLIALTAGCGMTSRPNTPASPTPTPDTQPPTSTTAILNTGNSFDLKTIEGGQMAMEGLHGFKNKDIEKVSYRSPEFYLCA